MSHLYSCKEYAFSFNEDYEPIHLKHSDSWVLKQAIANTGYHDIKSCYPRYVVTDKLNNDLKILENSGLVSFTAITDVFCCPDKDQLVNSFDYVAPFKTHYIINYACPVEFSQHHRYEIRHAQKNCQIKIIQLKDHLEKWLQLYNHLIEKHEITNKFSILYFNTLAQLNNLVTIAAYNNDGEIIGMHLWLVHNQIVYSHLAAASTQGYGLCASYAIYNYAIEYFKDKAAIDFGSCAGKTDDVRNGLAYFKKGFSNEEKPSFVCGKILNSELFNQLSTGKIKDFFPPYRYEKKPGS